MGVSLVACSWQKWNNKKNNIVLRALELISASTVGQLGNIPGFSADQLYSAVVVENCLRPVTLEHASCLMKPSTTEPLTLKPLN